MSDDEFGDDSWMFADANVLDKIETEALAQKAKPATKQVNKSFAAPLTRQPSGSSAFVQRDLFGNSVAAKASTSGAAGAKAAGPSQLGPSRLQSQIKQPILKVVKRWDRSIWAQVGWGGAEAKGKGKGKGKRHAKDSDEEDFDEDEEDEDPETSLNFNEKDPELHPSHPPPKPTLKIDADEAKTWVYPTNKQLRDYQFNITRRALFNNVLCSLPTGLGKTFIAAVVMLNFYRWFPDGKVIFMAPTRPLVAQQIEACHSIAGIPCSDAAEMTGNDPPQLREQAWKTRRVFYCTPQTVRNDLMKGRLDPKSVICIIIDEAHKATGDFAYCGVVRYLMTKNPHFRILALTATPGSKPEAVQGVVDSLHIGHIEVRTDDALDIQQYMHRKETDKLVVDLPPDFAKIRDAWAKLMDDILKPLIGNKLIYPAKALTLHSFACQKAMQGLGRGGGNGWAFPSLVQLGEMARGMEYLLTQSITSFKDVLDSMKDKARQANKKNKMTGTVDSPEFKTIFREVEHLMNAPGVARHPKMDILQARILAHFNQAAEEKVETRVMVFSSYRLVVEEIVDVLNKHRPLLNATKFVGQGADRKGKAGFNQKQQLQTIKDFKDGKFNVLVATSIGEEGLDIGEVDIIYCYESSKSPIRMLQRIGRTGRARDGKVVVLMTRDREDRNWDKAKSGYDDVQNAVVSGKAFEMYSDCEMLNPNKQNIECVKKAIEAAPFDKSSIGLSNLFAKARAEKKPPKPPKDPKRNVPANALGFQKASAKLKKPDAEVEDRLEVRKKAALLNDEQFAEIEGTWRSVTLEVDSILDITARPLPQLPVKAPRRPLQDSKTTRRMREILDQASAAQGDQSLNEAWSNDTFRGFKRSTVHWWSREDLGTSKHPYHPCASHPRKHSAPLNLALARENSKKIKRPSTDSREVEMATHDPKWEEEECGGTTDDDLDAALAALSSNQMKGGNPHKPMHLDDSDASDEKLPEIQPVKFRAPSQAKPKEVSKANPVVQKAVQAMDELPKIPPKRESNKTSPIDLDSDLEKEAVEAEKEEHEPSPLLFPIPTYPTDSSSEEDDGPLTRPDPLKILPNVLPNPGAKAKAPKPRISDEFDDCSMDFGEDVLAEIDALAAEKHNALTAKSAAAPIRADLAKPSKSLKTETAMLPPALPSTHTVNKRKISQIVAEAGPSKMPKHTSQLSQNNNHLRKTFAFKPPLAKSSSKTDVVISSSSPIVLGPGARRAGIRRPLEEGEVNVSPPLPVPKRKLKPIKATQAATGNVKAASPAGGKAKSTRDKPKTERTEPKKKEKKAPVTSRNNQFIANSQASDSEDNQSDSSVYQSEEDSQDRRFVAHDDSCDASVDPDAYHNLSQELEGKFAHARVVPGAYKMRFGSGRRSAEFAATQRRTSSPVSDYLDMSGIVADDATIIYDTDEEEKAKKRRKKK